MVAWNKGEGQCWIWLRDGNTEMKGWETDNWPGKQLRGTSGVECWLCVTDWDGSRDGGKWIGMSRMVDKCRKTN